MADFWKCTICAKLLRCSCDSQECGFEYDIKNHVRIHLKTAIAINQSWWELDKPSMLRFVDMMIDDNNG